MEHEWLIKHYFSLCFLSLISSVFYLFPLSLRHKAVVEIRKLRRQLTNEINLIIPSCDLFIDPDLPPPSEEQVRSG